MALTEHIGFGGGCHWCTEAVFQGLIGIERVEQGFACSVAPEDAWSEAVQLWFDPEVIPLDVLLAAHLHTHSSTSTHALRSKYRSAIYTTNAAQAQRVERALCALQADWESPLVTRGMPLVAFKLNDPKYLNYYSTRPDAPFCRVYITPKMATLRRLFSPYVMAP